MLVTLAAVGKLKAGPDQELFQRYWDRLKAAGKSSGITSLRVVELPESRAQTIDERKADEAARLLKSVTAEAFIVALDERGAAFTSPQFAASLGKWCGSGRKELALMIGGPDGHASSLIKRADVSVALGTMTLPHGLARVVLAEQIYRAVTILSGHPYHRS
ncbi:MAG: 23S rRNA (pseudouridine(1915)-N(3))-methyltransferase RlmH [Hyphomicrobiaceae bacterium]|nr:23S rRNA (pseudouridine(1915)-N(3))-methyltransferase RlmH [Hyphomicrobiaceae bacterium]